MHFTTRAIHAGQEPEATTGAVNVPVFLTSTYAQESVGVVKFADYARGNNPTRAALETVLASLEEAEFAVAFSSGLAAVDAVLRTLTAGDRVIMSTDAYGGTYRMLTKVFGAWGIHTDIVDLSDVAALSSSWVEGTALVWAETPSNPFLRIVDIAAVAEIAHQHGAKLVVDNTFATPYLQTPLTLGADVVVHSTTKSRWSLGRHWRCGRDQRPRPRVPYQVLAVRRWCGAWTARLLPRDARYTDPRCANGPTPRKCSTHCGVFGDARRR
jgi:cystathionine gamma-synthase